MVVLVLTKNVLVTHLVLVVTMVHLALGQMIVAFFQRVGLTV